MSGQREPVPVTRSGGTTTEADGTGSTRSTRMAPLVPASSVPPVPPVLPWLRAVLWETAERAQRTALRLVVLVLVLVLILWVSIFLYGSFYFSFLPAASFSVPVHLLYPTSDRNLDPDQTQSFPAANVSLLRSERDPVLVSGQPYRVSLDLELPESPVNRRLGMFVVGVSILDRDGLEVAFSARSTMLHYRSGLLRTAGTLVLMPALLAGLTEQKQQLEVELFSDYRPDARRSPRSATVQLRDRRVQVYSARLQVHASFTGLRYLLYNFPVTAAVVGVATNFLFLSLALLISYLQITWGRLWPPDPGPGPVRVLMGDNSHIQRRTQEARLRRDKNRREEKEEEKEVQEEQEDKKVKEEVHKEVQEEQEVQEEVLGPEEGVAELSDPFRPPETLRPQQELQNSEEDFKQPEDHQSNDTRITDPGPVLRQRSGL